MVNLPISWALELNLRHQLATKTVPVSSVIQFLQMQYYFLLLQLLSGNINFLLPTTDRISIGVMGISTGPRPETNVNAMICCVDRMAISRYIHLNRTSYAAMQCEKIAFKIAEGNRVGVFSELVSGVLWSSPADCNNYRNEISFKSSSLTYWTYKLVCVSRSCQIRRNVTEEGRLMIPIRILRLYQLLSRCM